MVIALLLGLAAAAHAEPFNAARLAFENARYPQAAKLFSPLAAEGDDVAKVYMGWMALQGKGLPKDYEKAAEYFSAASDAGDYIGQFELASLYDAGAGVAKDHARAVDLYNKSAEQGYAPAMNNLGVFKDIHELEPDESAKAFRWVKKAAELGEPFSELNLASCYWNGIGTAVDLEKARDWLNKASLAMDSPSASRDLNNLGYRWGKDAPNDPAYAPISGWRYTWLKFDWAKPPEGAKAFRWFENRAKAGDGFAQYALAAAYEEGLGEPKDFHEAARWYAKAAVQGVTRADKALKGLVASGRVTSRAAALARRAAEAPAVAAAAPATAAAPAEIRSDVDAPAFSRARHPDDLALVIGVEKYKTLPEARYAERDAAAARKTFVALGVPERNAVLLTGENATRSKIQAYVEEWLPKNAKPDSRVFVYFSGHGSPDAETKQALLVPWDADPEFLQSTAYPLKSLYASLSKIRAKSVIVALDACFSGAGGRSVIAAGARPLVTKLDDSVPGALTVFSASTSEQISSSLDAQGHGLFSYYFLKGLDGAAAGKDGRVTAQGLLSYLEPRVADEARNQSRGQTPTLSGDGAAVVVDVR